MTQPNKDLSYINNLPDLQKEIIRLKAVIKEQEDELEEKWSQLPKEALKSTAGAVLPSVVNNFIASRTFGLVKDATGLFLSSPARNSGGLKKILISGAKQLGVITAVKAALSMWKKRKL